MIRNNSNPDHLAENNVDLVELNQWWQDIIELDWGLNLTLIGDYIRQELPSNPKYKGFSTPQISEILAGKRDIRKIRGLKRLLVATFLYNFSERSPHVGHENHHLKVIDLIKNKKKESIPILFCQQKNQQTFDIAESFSGLYYCCAQDYDAKPLPFLFYIRKDGTVELAGKDLYFKQGFLAVIGLNVYFSLDSPRGHEPELYITSITKSIKNDIRYVTEFKMCGVWVDRQGRPAYGSCLLINQSIKSDQSILKNKNDLTNKIQAMLDKLPSLNSVPDSLFTDIEKEEEYINISTKVAEQNLSINTLNFEPNVSFEIR